MKKKLIKMAVASLYAGLFFALFWGIWSLFAPVPVLTEIKLAKNLIWRLPFAVSRWWDVLFAPLCVSAGFVWYFFLKSHWLDDLCDYLEEKLDNYHIVDILIGIATIILIIGTALSLLLMIDSSITLFFLIYLAFILSVILIFALIISLIRLVHAFIKFNKWVFGSDSK